MGKKKILKSKPKPLTRKQKRFVQEYTLDPNASKAAKKAGYSKNTAPKIGSENLQKPEIQAAIEKNELQIQEKFKLRQEDLVSQLMRIAFFDPMDVLEWNGDSLVFRKHMDKGAMSGAYFNIYPEYQTKEDKAEGIVRAKLSLASGERVRAIEALGRVIGMGKEKDAGSDTDRDTQRATLDRVRAHLAKLTGQGRGTGDPES